MADWSELHSDLVALIAGRLKEFEDFLAFGAVCRQWKSAATKDNFNCSSIPIPWLMLAEKKGEAFREFYSLSRSKIVARIPLPEAAGKVCYASQGWLVTVSQEDLEMNLLHPISRVRIPLPDPNNLLNDDPDCGGLLFFYESFIQKAVLSSSPTSTGGGDYSLCVQYGNRFQYAVWRSAGDFSWTKFRFRGYFSDIIYYQGKFFAISYGGYHGYLWAFDPQNPTSKTKIVLKQFVRCCASDQIIDKLYLVECGGKLLVVVRQGVTVREPEEKEWKELDEERIGRIDFSKEVQTYGTLHFKVFKLHLDLSSISSCVIGDSHWEEVHDLGRRALFLGRNSSFSIDIDAYDHESIKPNSIYFTDDAWISYLTPPEPNWLAPEGGGGGKDMGIYSFKDKTIVPHFQGKSYCRLTPPIWIQPTF